MNRPRLLTVPLASIDELAMLSSELDFISSENNHPQYKELVEKFHNVLINMLGLNSVLVYGKDEQELPILTERVTEVIGTLQ